MRRSLKAVYEKGVLRPLEPLRLEEHQEVWLTVTEPEEGEWLDEEFIRRLESQADDRVSIQDVRCALAKIPGQLSDDARRERDERR